MGCSTQALSPSSSFFRGVIELDESLKIAEDLDVYAYDAYLIQAALQVRSPLLTLDADLIEGAIQMRPSVIEVNR